MVARSWKFTAHPRLEVFVLVAVLLIAGVAVTYSALKPGTASAPADGKGPHSAAASAPADVKKLHSMDSSGMSAARPGEGDPYTETGLLFGTARPDGGPEVTERQFRSFVDEFVTPRFPEGLTVQTGQGQYRDAHGTIERERSYELSLLYPRERARANDPKVEQIRKEYVRRFDQEAVARVDDSARVDF